MSLRLVSLGVRRSILAATLLITGAAPARARDDPPAPAAEMNADALRAALGAARARAADGARPFVERRQALDECLDLRRRLLDQAPDSPLAQRAATLLDQTDDALRRLGLDGWESAALVGVVPRNAIDALKPLAVEAHERAADATDRLAQAIHGAEAGAAPADRAEFDAWVSLRDRRQPLLLARAALVRAGFEDDPALRRSLAADALAAAGAARESTAERESRRLTLRGLAALGTGDAAGAVADLQRAAASAVSPTAKAEATLGAALAVCAARGPGPALAMLRDALTTEPFIVGGKRWAPGQILAADAQHRIGAAQAQRAPEGPQRDAALAAAYSGWLEFLRADDLGIDAQQRTQVILPRLATVAPDDPAQALHVPAIVAFAKATRLMRTDGGFEAARAMLEGVTEPGSARLRELGPLGADALHTLATLQEQEARAYEEDHRLVPAIETLLRVGAEHPASPAARPSMAKACQMALGLSQAYPQDAEYRRFMERAMEQAAARFPDDPLADHWRAQSAPGMILAGRIDDALRQLDAITSDAQLVAYARFAGAQARASEFIQLRDGDGDEARTKATELERRAKQAIEAIDAALPTAPDPETLRIQRTAARAYRAAALFTLGVVDEALAEARQADEEAGAQSRSDAAPLALSTRVRAEARSGMLAPALQSALRLCERFPASADRPLFELCEALTDAVNQAERGGAPDRARALAAESLLPAATAALGAAEKTKTPALDAFRMQAAEAMVRAGQTPERAAEILRDLIQRNGPDARSMVWLAEALLLLQREDDAVGVLRETVVALDRQQQARPGETTWRAWSRLLEILARRGATPEQAEMARRRIAFFRLQDASLGGEPFASRLTKAEAAFSAAAPNHRLAPGG